MSLAQTPAQKRAVAQLGGANPQFNEPSGVEATTVPLFEPSGLAYDSAGNLYIADLNDDIVRKVNLQGIITTVAGDGEQGYGGDGGAATSALLDSPAGIAVDSSGNLYIADTHNNRIRFVSAATGIITTIAGTGVAAFSGDGGAATAATLDLPIAVAVDPAGNVYIGDTNNHRIRKITGTTITTVAGNGDQGYEGDSVLATATGLDSPNGVALDASLNIYISDTHNQRVRLVIIATGIITTFAGNGTRTFGGDTGAATSASLDRPRGIAVDASGKVYVADSDNNRVRTVSGGTINTLAGDGEQGFSGDAGASTASVLDTPRATAVFSSGGVTTTALSDANNERVRAVSSSNGVINTVAGLGAPGLAITLTGAATEVYGAGSITATFTNNGKTGTGTVTLMEGTNTLGSGTLSSNVTTIAIPVLSVGIHNLVATYPGDTNNPSSASGIFVLTVNPAPIVATTTPISVQYGLPIPALTGTLTGVLPQDSANVTAVFSTSAFQGSPVGVYPITVSLTGSAAANYSVTLSPTSGSVTITIAGSKTVVTSSSNPAYLGLPVPLTATVSSLTTGTPAGTVTFFDGAANIGGPFTLNASGAYTFTTSALALGTHSITATYNGSTNIGASTSAALSQVIQPDTDFSLAEVSGPTSVIPGSTTTFIFAVTPNPAPFNNPITFSVSGLPTGATATFSPTSVTPGSAVTNFNMILQTPAIAMLHRGIKVGGTVAFALLLFPLFSRRRKLASCFTRITATMLLIVGLGSAVTLLSGCGTSNGFFGQPPANYTITVIGTSTSVTGATLTHSTTVALTVQ